MIVTHRGRQGKSEEARCHSGTHPTHTHPPPDKSIIEGSGQSQYRETWLLPQTRNASIYDMIPSVWSISTCVSLSLAPSCRGRPRVSGEAPLAPIQPVMWATQARNTTQGRANERQTEQTKRGKRPRRREPETPRSVSSQSVRPSVKQASM